MFFEAILFSIHYYFIIICSSFCTLLSAGLSFIQSLLFIATNVLFFILKYHLKLKIILFLNCSIPSFSCLLHLYIIHCLLTYLEYMINWQKRLSQTFMARLIIIYSLPNSFLSCLNVFCPSLSIKNY